MTVGREAIKLLLSSARLQSGHRGAELTNSYDEGPVIRPTEAGRQRRNAVPEIDTRNVAFARRFMHPEQIEAVKQFLSHATGDEIATIRKLYGETPEVLRAIGLDVD